MRYAIALCVALCPFVLTHAQDKPADVRLPYTQEQAREFLLPWRTATYTETSNGSMSEVRTSVRTVTLEWRDVTDDGFTLAETNMEEGKAGRPWSKTYTWQAYMDSLQADLKDAKISDVQRTFMGREMDLKHYLVKRENVDGEGTSRTLQYWFSAEFPGVFMRREINDKPAPGRDIVGTEPHSVTEINSLAVSACKLPWTQKQIQEFYAKAPQFTWETSDPYGDKFKTVEGVSNAGDDGFTRLEGVVRGDDKVPGKPHKVTWDRLLESLTLPAKDTKSSEETIETPAGKFKCVVLEHERLRGGGVQTTKVWLSKDHPGLMVKWVQDMPSKGEPRVTTKVLTELKVE